MQIMMYFLLTLALVLSQVASFPHPTMTMNIHTNVTNNTFVPAMHVAISTDGTCSSTATCAGSIFGSCCSQWGHCGLTPEHCGAGCQPAFGTCSSGHPPTETSTSSGPKFSTAEQAGIGIAVGIVVCLLIVVVWKIRRVWKKHIPASD